MQSLHSNFNGNLQTHYNFKSNRCSFAANSFKISFSHVATFLWTFNSINLFNLSTPVVLRRYVFKRLNVEKDLSFVEVVTGRVAIIWGSFWTPKNTEDGHAFMHRLGPREVSLAVGFSYTIGAALQKLKRRSPQHRYCNAHRGVALPSSHLGSDNRLAIKEQELEI